MNNLQSYQSELSEPEKQKFASSFLPFSSDFKRSPKGSRRPVNKYYQRTALEGPNERKPNKFVAIKKAVHNFYLDDEISAPSPGKNEFITRNKIKRGKRHLTDNLTNLFSEFCQQNENLTLLKALFFKLRPFWVVQPKINA